MIELDKRQRIMQAAEKLFSSRRFHEITTDEVARVAKVGKGTIYRFFRDKDDLFFETANSGFEELCQLVRERVARKAHFREQLLEACVQISQFFVRRRELFEMIQSEDGRMSMDLGRLGKRWQEKRKMLVDAVAGILSGGVKEGAVRSDVAPEVLANFLLGLLRTRTRDLQDYPESAKRFEVLVDVFCRGAGGSGIVPAPASAQTRAWQRQRSLDTEAQRRRE